MNCFIILFFLLCCNGGCNGCDHNHRHDCDDRRSGDSCNICDKPCHNCEREDRDCDCEKDRNRDRDRDRDCDRDRDRDRDDMTPPPWIKSNYANGDSCGCEK